MTVVQSGPQTLWMKPDGFEPQAFFPIFWIFANIADLLAQEMARIVRHQIEMIRPRQIIDLSESFRKGAAFG
jgi:hypothetical protein